MSSCCPGHLQRPACRGPKRGGATVHDSGLSPVCPSGPGQNSAKVDGGLPVQGRASRSQQSGALLHRAGSPCEWRIFRLPLPGQDSAPARGMARQPTTKRRERSRLDRCLAADDRQYRKLALPICVTPRARGERPGPVLRMNDWSPSSQPSAKCASATRPVFSHPDFFFLLPIRAHIAANSAASPAPMCREKYFSEIILRDVENIFPHREKPAQGSPWNPGGTPNKKALTENSVRAWLPWSW